MESGAITSYIDVAQVVLYAFWIFFFGLILYLRREDKREGYPLESERSGHISVEGFPAVPRPKTFRLASGQAYQAPRAFPEPELRARPSAPWPGAPLEPTGDALTDGVGPAAYALREPRPDVTIDGLPRIVPLRVANEFHADGRDAELRGMPVYGADGRRAGTVEDLWIDRSEPQIRYIEIAVAVDESTRNVLMPIHSAEIDAGRGRIEVPALLASQFASAPTLALADEVTLREEDRIAAYFAGGKLLAEPGRREPLL
jgi:photosynthetic reaction center H subunit